MSNCFEYQDILDSLFEGVYCVDTNREIVFWNKGAERITGYSAKEVRGSGCGDNILVHTDEFGQQLCKTGCPLFSSINRGEPHSEENIFLHHKEGHRVPVRVSVSTIKDDDGQIIGAIEIFKDNVAKVHDDDYIEDLKKAALLDHLTGLPNRRYIEMKLSSAFDEMKRHTTSFGVLLIDIDHFKGVNDNFGHNLGDRVLQMVSRTLENNVRSYNLVGRWGGEEFLAIINHVKEEQLQIVAAKLRALVKNSFLDHEGQQVRVTVTIGSTMAKSSDAIDSLLARADVYLYQGKNQSRDCVVLEGEII